MKQSKKNGFIRFCCYFCPGAAEMYMGFMKSGFSLLVLFALTFAIPATMYGGDIFFVVPFVIYVYAFFHAINVSRMDEETFASFEDRYIWAELLDEKAISIPANTGRKWAAIILIVFGICCIWSNMADSLRNVLEKYLNTTEYQIFREIVDNIPQYAIAILAIVVGAKLISGKKESIEAEIEQAKNGKEA